MGAYVVELQGAKVKVSVVDDYAVVGPKIEELKSSFRSSQRLVGLDVKHIRNKGLILKNIAKLFILCAGTHCLIIQLRYPVLFLG